jgi:VIT1/CCC1 family predicted Fe2+/Mn2+ transporter
VKCCLASLTQPFYRGSGSYLKSLIYGGLDGIITTFAVVAGAAGARLSLDVILILGFANLVADGLSMGLGDVLSSKAEQQFAQAERIREMWECNNYLEVEKREMQLIFIKKGLSSYDAKHVVDILSKDANIFVDVMMVEELGIMPEDEGESPYKNGAVTFGAFQIFGVVPLLCYLVAFPFYIAFPQIRAILDIAILICSAISVAITLFTLGAVKGRFTSQRSDVSGLLMLMNGSAAAVASFVIGFFISEALKFFTCQILIATGQPLLDSCTMDPFA